MADRISTDPFDILQISKDWITAQQNFLPSGPVYEKVAQAVRDVAQAQIAYNQALARANAALLATLLQRPVGGVLPTDTTEGR